MKSHGAAEESALSTSSLLAFFHLLPSHMSISCNSVPLLSFSARPVLDLAYSRSQDKLVDQK